MTGNAGGLWRAVDRASTADGSRNGTDDASVDRLRGAAPETVRDAIDRGDPFPGTTGFAGLLDGSLVRDVLGREPLYVDGDEWAFDPTALADPSPFPPGAVDDGTGPESVWSLPSQSATGSDTDTGADSPDPLAALETAVEGALADLPDDVPVAFSGGVDSGLVASATDGPLYVAGFPDSQDVESARTAAAAMDRDLTVVELDHERLRRAVVDVADAIGRTNAMDVAIAVPLYLVAERAAADGHDALAVGQGADELFGGYAKVARAPRDHRVEADTVVGARDEVLATLPEQLPRDVLALRAAGVEPVAPLLDDRVVEAALTLPGDLLVEDATAEQEEEEGGRDPADAVRKVALRRLAADRVPEATARREKKALQYGSLVSRELDRLARQAGFKRRHDDHVSRYVAALAETGPDGEPEGPAGRE